MLPCTGERSQRHTILHVSFGNSFGLASALPPHRVCRVRQNDTLVVTTHGIIKKTQKTPSKEIKRAEDIRIEYFNTKNRK